MSIKKYSIIISFIIIFTSITAVTITQFLLSDSDLKQYLTGIFYGVFGSGIVTEIIYISEYNILKKEVLINYYNEAFIINNKFRNLKYLLLYTPIDLIKAYYNEIAKNEPIANMFSQLSEPIDLKSMCKLKIETEAREKLKIYFKTQNSVFESRMDKYEFNQFINEKLICEIKECDLKIDKLIIQYIDLIKINYREMENIYGKINFFFVNKTRRKDIYINIHNAQREVIYKAREIGSDLERYNEGNVKNRAVAIDYINKIQKILFIEENRKDNIGSHVLIYNDYVDRMDRTIEKLRASIYHILPEYQQRQCIMAITKSIIE